MYIRVCMYACVYSTSTAFYPYAAYHKYNLKYNAHKVVKYLVGWRKGSVSWGRESRKVSCRKRPFLMATIVYRLYDNC